MIFKTAKIEEVDLILNILNSVAKTLKSKNVSQWTQWLAPQPKDIAWITDKINDSAFFFVFIENELAGMFSLSDTDEKYWSKQTVKAKYLHSLTTLPKFKGQSFGKRVVSKIKIDLLNTDYKYIRLDCISTNTTLKNYYQSQGFNYLRTININSNSFLLHQFEL
jgi:ribosomal protein S18 acetylase RimI-like enzyme